MTRYAPLWQQNSTYPAAVDRGLLSTLWPSSGSTGGAATVVANTMNVSVAAGTAAVALASSAGTALCRWDAPEVVTLTAAPPSGQSRIDVIVIQVRDAALDAGANNDFIVQAIAGTPATTGSQVAPAVPNNAYAVAQLTIAGGIANLNGVAVTDRRRPINPRDVLEARVYRNAAFTFSGGQVTLPFDSVSRDPWGMWQMANSAFVIPVAGLYLVTVHVTTAPATNTQWLNIILTQNGGTVALTSGTNAIAAGYIVNIITDLVPCAVGDSLVVQGQPQSSSPIVPASYQTYFAIAYYGTG
jgi:hypothetical protein